MGDQAANCPRCGAALRSRAGNRECEACGYFELSAVPNTTLPGASRNSGLENAVDARPGFGTSPGAVHGLLYCYERSVDPSNPYAQSKLIYLIVAGILLTAGNIAVLFTNPLPPEPRLIELTAVASLITVVFIAGVLYVDWAAAKLLGALAAAGFIAWDIYWVIPEWAKLSVLAQVKHAVDVLLLLILITLLILDWRLENTPVES